MLLLENQDDDVLLELEEDHGGGVENDDGEFFSTAPMNDGPPAEGKEGRKER